MKNFRFKFKKLADNPTTWLMLIYIDGLASLITGYCCSPLLLGHLLILEIAIYVYRSMTR